MRLSQGERGPPGGGGGGSRPVVSCGDVCLRGAGSGQRPAPAVRHERDACCTLTLQPRVRLNAHLWSIMSSSSFHTPVEATARVDANGIGPVLSASRLSSFGFSGTIAHGAFCALAEAEAVRIDSSISLYRASLSLGKSPRRLHLRPGSSSASAPVSAGTPPLSPVVDAAFSEHVVGGGVLLPGVGYVEMAMAFSRGSKLALDALSFLRPCPLPGLESKPLAKSRPALRYLERVGRAFEIASSQESLPPTFVTHAMGS